MSQTHKRSPKRKHAQRIRQEQIEALGPGDNHRAFCIPLIRNPTMSDDEELFNQLFPNIEEWALEDEYEPQTFLDFENMERWKLTKNRRTIYILALDEGVQNSHVPLQTLVEFTSAYFSLPVKVLQEPKYKMQITFNTTATKRQLKYFLSINRNTRYPLQTTKNELGDDRFNVHCLLDILGEHIPKSAYCVLGITSKDIYEFDETDNIIMGRGTGDRVGLLSLYRFDPSLQKQKTGEVRNGSLDTCKTLAHETMHMFGLDHCTHFICVMNANVSPEGNGKDPIHLCPICLKKLHHAVNFDIGKRYEKLLSFYTENGWQEEENWLTKRINSLRTTSVGSERDQGQVH